MKKRDLIGLVIAVALIAITGVLLYTQIAPAPKDTGIKVVVPAKVKEPLSEEKVSDKVPSDAERMSELERYSDYSSPQECNDEKCGGFPPPI